MEQKAQGAIEYLLIIGAAILVVAIVILAVTGALGQAKGTQGGAATDVNLSMCKADCNALPGNVCNTTYHVARDSSGNVC